MGESVVVALVGAGVMTGALVGSEVATGGIVDSDSMFCSGVTVVGMKSTWGSEGLVVVDEEVVTGGSIVEGRVDSASMCCSDATVVEITSMGGSDVICYPSKSYGKK